ncbi:hypothetical protein BNJ_00278 [Kaumoebavirus]|nr:hypothetical protein BNJ_00278 [Kaumoebavirus]ARA72101.1 hypothetical protein BNJ_00278 [Kaumoebavirus]
MDLYVDKNTRECFTTSNVEALAITGLVFFCLTGIAVLGGAALLIKQNVK